MEQIADIVIVSIFDRGNWLATELAAAGWKVTLVDVSERMGAWNFADREGPFPLFQSADLSASQLESYGPATSSENGFAIWLKEGPLEFRGDMSEFLLKKNQINVAAVEYLRRAGAAAQEGEKDARILAKEPFENVWPAHFAHQWAATIFEENQLGLREGMASPLFAPVLIPSGERPELGASLAATSRQMFERLEAAGLSVFANASVKDVRLNQGIFEALELEGSAAKAATQVRARTCVWMLSGEETLRFGSAVQETLLPQGALGPDWYWTRFGVELRGRDYQEQLAPCMALIEDLYLPWTHANYMIMRARGKSRFDLWMRLPMWARFDHDYLDQMRLAMEKNLAARLPQVEILTAEMPAERSAGREKQGPPRFPVFNRDSHGRTKMQQAKNLLFDGPELWPSLDPLGQMRQAARIFKKLVAMKQIWDQEAQRAQQKLERKKTNLAAGHEKDAEK